MKLTKVDLSSLKAIAHDDDGLKLLIERGSEIEYIEISAPLAAYEGLQLLDRIIGSTSIEMLPACSAICTKPRVVSSLR